MPRLYTNASAVTVGKQVVSQSIVTADEMLQCVKAIPKGYRKSSKVVVSDVRHTSMLA